MYVHTGIKTAISDFAMLAFSSKRSGKKDIEAMAYVSLGVIHDNQNNFLKAIENYQLYADLCEEMGDSAGVACAYNCLGVNYLLLANPPSDCGFVGDNVHANRFSDEAQEYLNLAAQCHRKHLGEYTIDMSHYKITCDLIKEASLLLL